jgi:hypothetical protein
VLDKSITSPPERVLYAGGQVIGGKAFCRGAVAREPGEALSPHSFSLSLAALVGLTLDVTLYRWGKLTRGGFSLCTSWMLQPGT